MKTLRLLSFLLFASCATLTPGQSSTVNALASAVQAASPFTGNPALSAALYGLAAIARAYADAHMQVPPAIVRASVPHAPRIAGAVLVPMSTSNGEQTVAQLLGAAKLLGK